MATASYDKPVHLAGEPLVLTVNYADLNLTETGVIKEADGDVVAQATTVIRPALTLESALGKTYSVQDDGQGVLVFTAVA